MQHHHFSTHNENSTHNQNSKALKKRRKRRGRHFAVSLIVICVSIGLLRVYPMGINNMLKMSPMNHVVSYQSELLPPQANSLMGNQNEKLPDEKIELHKISSDVRINSTNAILLDLECENILFSKNGEETIYPASMTKIMTALIVLENVNDLSQKVFLSDEIFKPIYEDNASVAGFLPGESVRIIDLLYGLMLPSGAECAVGLAEYVAGSESRFVELMNDKAKEIGMSNSNFLNATGLHHKGHYSTAIDMAQLLQYALANSTFYEIVTSVRHSTPSTNRHNGGITYYSTLFSKIDTPDFDGGTILGGKTGYTEEAGQCLASFAEKDGSQFILVTSGAHKGLKQQNLHFEDAIKVYTAILSID